jgi:hypothetical protein
VRQRQPAGFHRNESSPRFRVAFSLGASLAFFGVEVAFSDLFTEVLWHDATPQQAGAGSWVPAFNDAGESIDRVARASRYHRMDYS